MSLGSEIFEEEIAKLTEQNKLMKEALTKIAKDKQFQPLLWRDIANEVLKEVIK